MLMIGELPFDDCYPLYRRADGTTWLKLNEKFHITAYIETDGFVVNGITEGFNPKEKVVLLDLYPIEEVTYH